MKFCRTLCLLLAALLVLMSGCGAPAAPIDEPTPTVIVASGDPDGTPAPELLASRAYQKHYYKLPGTLTSVWDICADAQYLYLLGVDSAESARVQLWRMGLDGSGETQLHTFYEMQTESGWCYHSRLLPQKGGGVWVQEVEGAEVYVFPEGITAEEAGPERWDYYDHTDIVTRLYGFSGDGKAPIVTQVYSGREPIADLAAVGGNVIYGVDKTIRILAPDGKQLASHTADRAIYGLAATDDALYAVTASDDGENAEIRKVALSDATLSEPLDVLPVPFFSCVGALEGGVVAELTGDLFLYQPDAKQTQKLVDWLDYSVNPLNIAKSYVSENVAIAVLVDGDPLSRSPASLVVLTPSSTSVLPTGTLTVAALYPDAELIDAVLAFNSESKDRVRLVDYSEYDFFAQNAQAQLTSDLTSNRCPDLVYSSDTQLPADRLAAGKLIDLTPYLTADTTLAQEKLLPAAVSLLQKNGALYTLAPYFLFHTTIGKASVIGSEPLTIETAARLSAVLPEGGSICDFYQTRDAVFSDRLACVGDYLQTNGRYRFASQVFYDVLAYAKLFPNEVDWNRFGAADYSGWARVRRGSQLVIADTFADFKQLAAALHSVGEDGVICGMPAVPGGHTLLFPITVGITTACGDSNAAWQFVRTMMLADYQQKRIESYAVGFPVNETALDAVAAAALASEETSLLAASDLTVEVSCRPTNQEYDAMLAAIRATVAREYYDGTLVEVILPTAQRYFSGELDAPRAAQKAQTAWDEIATTTN